MKVYWRKGRIQGGNSFSLAELQKLSVSCRNCNAHLSLLGPVTDHSFLMRIILEESIIDSSSCNSH